MNEQEVEAVGRIREMLGEHFHNFSFSVMTEGGGLFYDYTNPMIGEMLFSNSLRDMSIEILSDSVSLEELFSDDEDDEYV